MKGEKMAQVEKRGEDRGAELLPAFQEIRPL